MTTSLKILVDSPEFKRLTETEQSREDPQLEALREIASAVRESVRALTISQYILMAVLLVHAVIMVKNGW